MHHPVAQSTPFPAALAIATALCLVGLAAGVPLDTTKATVIACGAILVIGLPHGTLDLDLFRQAQPGVSRSLILLLYLGLAAAMAATWLTSPVFALALFYGLAVVHFAEDWSRTGSAFLAHAVALALLALPALTHPIALTGLFAAIAGTGASAIIVDLLRSVAPVATMVALAAIGLLWSVGARADALGGSLALVSMAMLPPVIGFALFFCLFHSPLHLHSGLAALSAHAKGQRGATVLLLTLAAIGIANVAFAFGAASPLSERAVAASFTTWSILTLPHMAVPIVLRALDRNSFRIRCRRDGDDRAGFRSWRRGSCR